MARINARSELLHARLHRVDEVVFWGTTEPPEIAPADDDLLYTVTEIDRIDNLAFAFYGDEHLEWVIKRANGIYLIPNDMRPGDEIRIPSFERLLREGIVLR